MTPTKLTAAFVSTLKVFGRALERVADFIEWLWVKLAGFVLMLFGYGLVFGIMAGIVGLVAAIIGIPWWGALILLFLLAKK